MQQKLIFTFKTVFEDHFGVGERYRVGRIVQIPVDATTSEIKHNLPIGYSFATEEHLLGYKGSYQTQTRGTVMALGSAGPAPYVGYPGWTVEGEIQSFGRPISSLKWKKDSLFLLMRDDQVEETAEDILDFFKGSWNGSHYESTAVATFNEQDGNGERIALLFSAEIRGDKVQCTFRYIDDKAECKEACEGEIPISAFSKIVW